MLNALLNEARQWAKFSILHLRLRPQVNIEGSFKGGCGMVARIALALLCLLTLPLAVMIHDSQAGGPPEACAPAYMPQYQCAPPVCPPPQCRPSFSLPCVNLCAGLLGACTNICGAIVGIPGAVMGGLLAPSPSRCQSAACPPPCPPPMCGPQQWYPACAPPMCGPPVCPPARMAKCR